MNVKKIVIVCIVCALTLPIITRAAFSNDLRFGSQGPEVAALQDFLRKEGLFTASSTGYYGFITKAAVAAYQARQGISPITGQFADKTRIVALIQELKAQLAVLEAKLASLTKLPDAQSIVGLNCFYKDSRTNTLQNLAKGSGVVVSPDGYILTVRHLVDFDYAYRVSPDSVSIPVADLSHLAFSYCDVARVPAGTALPDEDIIRKLNPATLASQPRLRAELVTILKDSRMSSLEEERFDVALLKIKDASEPLPYAGLLLDRNPREGEKVVTYGYPGDFSQTPNQDFSILYLLGGVGKVKNVYWGDKFFSDRPIIINTRMEIHGGRSGSPVFLDGKVVAIVSAYAQGDTTDSYSVSVRAIQRLLQNYINL